ncbi:ABC super family ATP binding cassette transporter binding protein [Bacillus sp. OxB-1]|uniref:metal ABC transporter solute-binding protein, Zn/Mn family n=1 Tax=Bacillus sp. (strain OxB-1) TaxID=98228 RepID=UPI000581D832|nr:zinc ABC transporter substrate-binding protein [Bacillus sp. OxB-1]BAQ08480.1 ABC super family ATP binding cassette transporter binding protein [Bacillus sp. OxB-1]
MGFKRFFILCLSVLLLLGACGKNEKNEANGKEEEALTVYTTVYPLQYFAERIGGSHVDVQSIYPAGADEHTFDPTQKDMMALADADLFFYIGLGLEGFVENARKTLKNEHVKLIPTAERIPEEQLGEGHSHEDEEHGHDDGGWDGHGHESHLHDPHVWISPNLSIALASSIKEALVEAAPEAKEEFEKNFGQLKVELEQLDKQFQKMAEEAPNKAFFVSHAAFGYLADRYGLDQVAVAGLNSQSEPSQKQLAILVNEAKEKDIKYVLFEQNVSSRLTEVIRKEIGAESLTLHNLGVLTKEDVEEEETYFTLMEHNLEALRTALSGE